MANTATKTKKVKKVRTPKPTTQKKRPNRTFIEQMADFRGHMTGDEKTQLATLDVKNAWQRINNRAMSEGNGFTGTQNAELQRLMKDFVRGVDEILKEA